MANLDDRSLEALTARLAAAGAREAGEWAWSEVKEDLPQTTRFLFLAAVWREMQAAVAHGMSTEPANRLFEGGADLNAVTAVLQLTVGRFAHSVLYLLDEPDGTQWTNEEGDLVSHVAPGDRRWRLEEVTADGTLTGRDVRGLHESIGDSDLSGQEGNGWLR